MRFLKLLDPRNITAIGPGLTIAKQAIAASTLFPQLVRESNLVYWRCGDPVTQEGTRFLVGVAATFSMADLRLLDVVNDLLKSKPRTDVVVDVFDVDDIMKANSMSEFFPGLTSIVSTPVVGVWKNGHMETVMSGANAMNSLLRYFGLPDTAESLVKSVRPPTSDVIDDVK